MAEKRRFVRWLPLIFGVALLGGVIAAAVRFSEVKDFVEISRRAQPVWLLLALAAQAGTYAAQGQVFRAVARAAGHRIGLGAVLRLSLAKLFVDQALPSAGLSGTLLLTQGLERAEVPKESVATSVIVDSATYQAAYVVSLAAAVGYAAWKGVAPGLVILAAAIFVVLGLGFSAAVLVLAEKGAPRLPKRLGKLKPVKSLLEFIEAADASLARRPAVLAQAFACHLAIILLDASTLWLCTRSVSADANPPNVFASFMISTLFRRIGLVPGGLGTFEASSVVTLRVAGVAGAAALAATLLFRGLSFWLPMLPGLWFSRAALKGAKRE